MMGDLRRDERGEAEAAHPLKLNFTTTKEPRNVESTNLNNTLQNIFLRPLSFFKWGVLFEGNKTKPVDIS
ncbi:MAG: hypothetical protein GXO67_06355 [Archaeoglobi archaeon]|nr:hypothetical protein [Archaeoglobi archaeon]